MKPCAGSCPAGPGRVENNPSLQPSAFSLSHITAGYPRCPAVLHDVSMELRAGESLAVIGPNGAGKSTLLRVMTGLVKPGAGNVALFGRPLHSLSNAQRARFISVVPQDLETAHPFTLFQMVMMARMACRGRFTPPGEADRAAVLAALEEAGLRGLAHHLFMRTSGGERQRAVIAMAMAVEPQVILMDEPTSHLDMAHRVHLIALWRRLHARRGVTTLMIGHDLSLAAEHFPRILLLDRGRVVADGPPAEVLTPGILERVYHCPVTTHTDPANNALRVFPKG
jgi:iron complex transport system ATP-binding protein